MRLLWCLLVPPSITLAVDSIALVLLTLWTPSPTATLSLRWIVAGSLVLVTSFLVMTSQTFVSIGDIEQTISKGEMIVLEPEKWHGKPFPLQKMIVGRPIELTKGSWKVIIFHEDCYKCQELIRASEQEISRKKTAFVEIPPFTSAQRPSTEFVRWYRLSEEYKWFASTPQTIELADGITN